MFIKRYGNLLFCPFRLLIFLRCCLWSLKYYGVRFYRYFILWPLIATFLFSVCRPNLLFCAFWSSSLLCCAFWPFLNSFVLFDRYLTKEFLLTVNFTIVRIFIVSFTFVPLDRCLYYLYAVNFDILCLVTITYN